MINVEKRGIAARLIGQLANGEITHDKFESEFPEDRGDAALRQIFMELWFLWNDLHDHKLDGLYVLNPSDREVLRRCEIFLISKLEYEWPISKMGLMALPELFLKLITLGAYSSWQKKQVQQQGDQSVWPFVRRSDFEEISEKFKNGVNS